MKPLYIFDLDGTLSLADHRRHFLEGKKPDWDSFSAACVDDGLNVPVADTLKALHSSGAEIWVWSGRTYKFVNETKDWLERHGMMGMIENIWMREIGCYKPDNELKLSWLNVLTEEDRDRLVAVFDDRNKVVEMWRSQGVPCFQVAIGDF